MPSVHCMNSHFFSMPKCTLYELTVAVKPLAKLMILILLSPAKPLWELQLAQSCYGVTVWNLYEGEVILH